MALDVSRPGVPGGDVPRRAVLHPRKPALPRLQGPREEGAQGADQPVRPGRGRPQDRRDPRKLLQGPPPELPRRRRRRARCSGRSSGPASCWRRSSSSSASTSSSTTARRCGSWPAFSEEVALERNIISGVVSIAGVLVGAGGDRQDRPQAAAADRLGRHGGDAWRDDLGVQRRGDRRGGQSRCSVRTRPATSRSSRPIST